MPLLNSINQMLKEMTEWRRYLHQIPEIGLKEYKTSEFIKNKLESWDIEFKSGFANTGLVAWVKGNKGNSDKSIGLRADFDALPMSEQNSFDYKSTNKNMMHACGHDGHTSMLLGAAKYLKENPNFDGTVYLIFQPGEEGLFGGKKMVEEGIFKEEKEAYGDCRTKAEDLYQSHLTLFETDHPVFINVCGKKIWSSVEPQLLKDYF